MPTEEQERDARIDAERKNVEIHFRVMYDLAKRGSLDGLADDVLAIATTNVNRIQGILALASDLRDARATMDGMDAALDAFGATIKAQRQEILTLKAALYDLMSA